MNMAIWDSRQGRVEHYAYITPQGVKFSTYKNYLHIETQDVTITLRDGALTIDGVQVVALRLNDSAVYFAAWWGPWNAEEGIIGVGVHYDPDGVTDGDQLSLYRLARTWAKSEAMPETLVWVVTPGQQRITSETTTD